MSDRLILGSIGGAMLEAGSAAIATTTGTITTRMGKVIYAGATYAAAPGAAHQMRSSCAVYAGQNVVFRDDGTSGPVSYVLIGDCAQMHAAEGRSGADFIGDMDGLKVEIGSARMVAGSCGLHTSMGRPVFVHWTYKDDSGTCDRRFWTPAAPTATSGNYITVKDTNLNALSADFVYLMLGN